MESELFVPSALDGQEHEVIERIIHLRGQVKWFTYDARRWTGLLRRSSLARSIQGSNSIEGYNASLDDVIAAVAGESPLDPSEETWQATIGYRNAVTYILQLSKDPHFKYSEGLIRSLHFMLLQYDLTKNPGLWRRGAIGVYREKTGEKVYEAPDAERVPELMDALVGKLDDQSNQPALVRAAMAHLNLTLIHPFSDGNGRMARCLQTLVLAREQILAPEFCSIEEWLGANTDKYYDVLAKVAAGSWHPERDTRSWIRFSLTAHFQQAQTVLRRMKLYESAWAELENLAIKYAFSDRVIMALHDATFGYRVRNSTYRAAAEISQNLASRDLKELADKGLLEASGEGRGRYYTASPVLRMLRNKINQPKIFEDPFLPSSKPVFTRSPLRIPSTIGGGPVRVIAMTGALHAQTQNIANQGTTTASMTPIAIPKKE
jgi:Fic family protein